MTSFRWSPGSSSCSQPTPAGRAIVTPEFTPTQIGIQNLKIGWLGPHWSIEITKKGYLSLVHTDDRTSPSWWKPLLQNDIAHLGKFERKKLAVLYRVFFFTGLPLKGEPVQNHITVPRLALPWSSPKSLSTWTGPPLKSQNYLSVRLALPHSRCSLKPCSRRQSSTTQNGEFSVVSIFSCS